MTDIPTNAQNLTTPYRPVALYYEGADILEYMREDVPVVHRRIDSTLTLVFDMMHRERLVGFSLKGFKAFYLSDAPTQKTDFVTLVGILDRVIGDAGPGVMEAYRKAKQIALEDRVVVDDLPKVAANGH